MDTNATVYILRCADDSFYVGSTTNLELRLWQHQSGEGAAYTRRPGRRPVELVYLEHFRQIRDAFAREKQIQNWSRAKRIALIAQRYGDLPALAKGYVDAPGFVPRESRRYGVSTGSTSDGGSSCAGGVSTGSTSDDGVSTGSTGGGGVSTGSTSDGGVSTGSTSDGGVSTGSTSDGGSTSGGGVSTGSTSAGGVSTGSTSGGGVSTSSTGDGGAVGGDPGGA